MYKAVPGSRNQNFYHVFLICTNGSVTGLQDVIIITELYLFVCMHVYFYKYKKFRFSFPFVSHFMLSFIFIPVLSRRIVGGKISQVIFFTLLFLLAHYYLFVACFSHFLYIFSLIEYKYILSKRTRKACKIYLHINHTCTMYIYHWIYELKNWLQRWINYQFTFSGRVFSSS